MELFQPKICISQTRLSCLHCLLDIESFPISTVTSMGGKGRVKRRKGIRTNISQPEWQQATLYLRPEPTSWGYITWKPLDFPGRAPSGFTTSVSQKLDPASSLPKCLWPLQLRYSNMNSLYSTNWPIKQKQSRFPASTHGVSYQMAASTCVPSSAPPWPVSPDLSSVFLACAFPCITQFPQRPRLN